MVRHSARYAVAAASLVLAMSAATVRAQDGSTAAVPAPAAPPTAAAGGWSAWAAVGGPSFLAPALAVNPNGGALELAAVGLDLAIDHHRFTNGAWSPAVPTGRVSFLPPALLIGAGGAPQLLATGPDAGVTHSAFQGNAWAAPQPTQAMSFLPRQQR